jgi:hypothetical protein
MGTTSPGDSRYLWTPSFFDHPSGRAVTTATSAATVVSFRSIKGTCSVLSSFVRTGSVDSTHSSEGVFLKTDFRVAHSGTIAKVSGMAVTPRRDRTYLSTLARYGQRESDNRANRTCTQRRLLSRAASLLASPRAISSRLPSRDQWKSKIMPESNFVNCLGSPPVSGCSRML